MKIFKDANGREWLVVVNTENAKRVRDMTSFNPLKSKISELTEDPILLVDVLYALCKPQAEKQNITAEQFGEALVGDPIEDATDALLQEVSNFFPSARRSLMQRAMVKGKEAEARAIPLLEKKMDLEMESILNGILGTSSTDNPASSESIPPS